MPAVAGTLRVEGLRQLQTAFALANARLGPDLRDSLKEAAEPVRLTAETLARGGIRRIGLPWSQMRIGVTRTSVYVAPKRRGTRIPSRRRPNLAPLLLEAETRALAANQAGVEQNVEEMLEKLAVRWGATG